MDLNCGSTLLVHSLAALERKLIWEGLIDMHLRNLFSVRMRLGMFDGNPTTLPYGSLGPADICTDANQELALEAARESLVLLKNEKNALHWKKVQELKLAVLGPHANATIEMLGNYEGKRGGDNLFMMSWAIRTTSVLFLLIFERIAVQVFLANM
jgi:beta-D-xylosidase 4